MKTDKITEALLDLQRQRDLIDNAIQSLQAILVRLNGHTASGRTEHAFSEPVIVNNNLAGPRADVLSYVNATIKILEAAGRPMHIKKIWDQIKLLRNNSKIKRQSVESTLLRHIQMKGDKAKVVKLSPGMYALPPQDKSARHSADAYV